MRALALLALVVAGLGVGAALTGRPLQQDPNLLADIQAGYCTRQVVSYTVFLPVAVQTRLQAAGYPITPTPGLPYKRLQGREFACAFPDGGSLTILPRLAALAEYFRPDLTWTVTSCAAGDAGNVCPTQEDGQDDGGADPVVEDTFECACSNGNVLADGGATCRYVATGGLDAGNAPVGLTLQPGTFQGPGCKPKACGELWLTKPDGTRVDSFPPACPTP